MVNKRVWNTVLGCNLKNDRMISVHLQGKPFDITVIQVYAPTSNAEEAEVEWFYEDLQDLLELTPQKMPPYLHWNQAPPKGQQVPEQGIPRKFSSNIGTQPWVSIYRQHKVTPKPLTSHNSLLDTSMHSREKKSSSTHQNTDTSFPNQDTLTTPPTVRKLHNKENSTNYQNTERPPQMQQYKQDEEREE